MSREAPRLRAPRPAAAHALVVALVLLAVAPAVAQKQSCFPSCDPMDPLPADCCPTDLVDVPCNDYLACQANNRSQRAACVEDFCMGHGALGQCDYAIKCSRACASSTTNCSKALRSSLQTAGACTIGRGAARRACSRCFPEEPKVCGDQLADTTGSGCQKQCIRAQPWIQECYQKCSDRCTSDRCAIAVCRRGCRDSICEILQNTCSPEGSRPGNKTQLRLQVDYTQCCGDEKCLDDSAEDIVCESTTSTTSSTSSSSTLQTTTTSLRTTTSTLSPTGMSAS